jgi:unspecific monooxygenase
MSHTLIREAPTPALPRPPMPTRPRTQLETLRVLRRNPIELWGEAAYTQPVMSGRLLGRTRVLLSHPAAIRHVLLDNADNYRRTAASRRVLRPILGEGLLLAEGAAWRHQRRTIAPALAPRTMPLLAGHVIGAAAALEPELESAAARGEPVSLFAVLRRLALTIAGRSMFSLEMDRFGGTLRTLMQRYAERHAAISMLDLLLPASVPSLADLGRRSFRAEWLRLLDAMIAERRAQASESDAPRDLFDLLCAARDPETGEAFTHAQLRDEVSTLILAGHETTAVALFWACYLAALFPEQQDRMAGEVAGADLSVAGAATAVDALVETRAHLDESLRLYPPAFLIVREAVAADSLPGGFAVAPRTIISMAPWVLHRHRLLWAQPERFDPARFLPDAPAPDRFAYMPFGAGPRICVGARFALTEAVLVLARLFRDFRLEIAGSAEVMPIGRVTIQPDRPVAFRLRRRR